MGTIRIGLLGAALIAPSALIGPAQKVPGVTVQAMAARDPGRARRFAARHGIPVVHSDYGSLVKDPQLDAIYIPLPNSHHCRWTIESLGAGKHVLCEKPFAANANEAMLMAKKAEESGRVVAEAFHYRYHPLAFRLKEIVQQGEIGQIRHLDMQFCLPLIFPRPVSYRYDLAGGATMDLGCYAVNMVRYLAGSEPAVLSSRAKLSSAQIDRYMEADLRFPNGITARIVCSIFSVILLRSRLQVFGSQGTIHLFNPFMPHRFHRLTVTTSAGRRTEKIPGDTTYTCQLRAFIKAIEEGSPMCTGPAEAVANMLVIDAIYQKAGLKRRGEG